MCRNHHAVIDNSLNTTEYTVEKLHQWKHEHESKITDQGDRGWINPPNQTILLRNKQQIHIKWWVDNTGRPQIYTEEKLNILKILFRLMMDLSNANTLLGVLPNMNNDVVKSLLQQSYGEIAKKEKGFVSHIYQLMLQIPNITFGEFIGYLAQGDDITPAIQAAIKRFNETLE